MIMYAVSRIVPEHTVKTILPRPYCQDHLWLGVASPARLRIRDTKMQHTTASHAGCCSGQLCSIHRFLINCL